MMILHTTSNGGSVVGHHGGTIFRVRCYTTFSFAGFWLFLFSDTC